MSATMAAYAAQAMKPSARVNGDGSTEEAITLLSTRPREDHAGAYAAATAFRSPTSLSLMLMNSNGRLPQGTPGEAVRYYREFEPDEPDPGESDERPEQDAEADEG